MQNITAIIVDDEANARSTINGMLQMFDNNIQIIGEAADGNEGLQMIEQLKPQLVFLDIQMPGKTGLQLLEEMQPIQFDVIFTTAYHEYAITAFKFSAIDYLLKPIDPQEMMAALEKIKQKKQTVSASQLQILQNILQQTQLSNTAPVLERIALSTAEGVHFVGLKEIVWIESLGAYTRFHITGQKPIVVSKILKEYEELLRDYPFVRVHQSSLINLQHIKKYMRGDGGQVWLSDGSEIEVSRRKKDELLSMLEKFAIK